MEVKTNQNPKSGFVQGLVLAGLLALSFFAQAAQSVKYTDKWIITFKSPQALEQSLLKTNKFFSSQSMSIDGINSALGLVRVKGQSLQFFNQLALMNQLANSASEVLSVEREVIHPLPFKPQRFTARPSRVSSLAKPINFDLWGLKAVKAEQAWALGQKGAGTKVAVIDTGVDKEHPALIANFVKGQDFIEDDNLPYPYFDGVGHGTHVAGTVLGSIPDRNFYGVAPEAKLYSGRVCSEQGCSNFDVAKGISWAVAEKVDVINLSLGGEQITPVERKAIAQAESQGVVIVAATGNSGENTVSFPAAISTVLAVGAVDPELKHAEFSQYGRETGVVAPGVEVISSVPVGTGRESEVSFVGSATGSPAVEVESAAFSGSKELLNPLTAELALGGLGKPAELLQVKGKVAVITRGELTFLDKTKNAIAAGAVGVIFVNNAPGLVQGSVSDDGSELSIAVLMISQVDGAKLKTDLTADPKMLVSISTVRTDYASFQGTSMATPHVAGVAALVRGANKALKPLQVRNLLKSTATPLSPNDKNQMGSGLVDSEKAVAEALRLKAK